MCFVTLKMNGNPTSQMFQCLHFPEGGEDICVTGFPPSQKNYLLSWWISGKEPSRSLIKLQHLGH